MDAIETLLLRRERLVFVPAQDGGGRTPDAAVVAFEAELLGLGAVLSAELRERLAASPEATFRDLTSGVLAVLADQLGADRPHVPLFRRFPLSTPADTQELFVARILHWWLQAPDQPCIRCGSRTAVRPVRPCGHLVCHECWDMTDYSGCPICHRRIELDDDPFFEAGSGGLAGDGVLRRIARRVRGAIDPEIAPAVMAVSAVRLTRLVAGESPTAGARALLERLLSRTVPLSPQDRDDVVELAHAHAAEAELWDTVSIPARETMAVVLAALLPVATAEHSAALLRRHATRPTDVLRVVLALQGADPGLTEMPERRLSLPRPLRRALLDRLDAFGADRLAEEMLARRELWKRTLRGLHPFATHARHPALAAAVAAVRAIDVSGDDALARAVRETVAASATLTLQAGTVHLRGWSSQVEAALRRSDVPAAVDLLRNEPGRLLRRVDHLLRLALDSGRPADVARITTAVAATVGSMSSPTLLTVATHLHHRHRAWDRRVFFPKGDLTLAWATRDRRRPLPPDDILPLVDVLEEELLRRAGGDEASHSGEALLDAALRDVPVPVAARSSSRALVSVPRGTRLKLPEAQPLRLFVHWLERDRRVDLDLSVAAFDERWRFVGLCDYTHLRLGDGAIHSGDLTSAPPPLGASEFVDLHADELEALGARHLVLVIFSYNDVAFDDMTEAFAGFMAAPSGAAPFDPAAVIQRFDLRNKARIAVPMLVDLQTRTMRWIDVNVTAAGRFHSVGGYRAALAHLGADLTAAFAHRPTVWDVACLLAAARHPRVLVRDGAVTVAVERRPGESSLAFARRLRDSPPDGPEAEPAEPAFAALLDDDIELPAGCRVVAVRTERHQHDVARLDVQDLLAI
jgi:hypothetical protein